MPNALPRPSREGCALGTEQREVANYAILKDAQILFRKEECAQGTGQIGRSTYIIVLPMDAQIML